jgi:indolepyruvate ferredoxin oxidoreductase alpha subunit
VRLTTRISHSKGIVEVGEREEIPLKEYKKDPKKFVILPAHARVRHIVLEQKLEKIREYAEKSELNKIEKGNSKIGIVASGVSYMHAKEVFKNATFLKLGFSYPFPVKKFLKFKELVDDIWVIEENDPFIEEEIKILGFNVKGKEYIPVTGELSPDIVRKSIKGEEYPHPEEEETVLRPPIMCAGCPHTGVFYVLSKLKANVTGDIGCYTLGALPPHNAMDTCICMGASIGNMFGFERARGEDFRKRTVAVIGDSTFFHSGIPGIIDMVYNDSKGTVIVLDNRTTAMTGHQGHPGTGLSAKGEKKREVKIDEVVKAIGVDEVYVVKNPYEPKSLLKTIKTAMESDKLSVVVVESPCALLKEQRKVWVDREKKKVISEKCLGEKCKACIKVGCPAISMREGKAYIDEILCVGCDLCVSVCPTGAIV